MDKGDRRTAIEDAYRDDLAYVHDTGHTAIARDAAERLLDELSKAGHRVGTIVDLGCGSGVLADRLAKAGYRVVGIDVSHAMIALARARTPSAEFQVGSFVSADLPACVAVAAVGEVVNYCFDPANGAGARRDLVRRVHDALRPGGLFLFDVAGPERAKPGKHRTFTEGEDWTVLVEADSNGADRVVTRTITTFRQVGTLYRRSIEVHRLELVDPVEELALLRGAGFEARAIQGYGATALPHGVVGFLCRKQTLADRLQP
jgi:SAM-dependent methyltransferase